MDTADKLAALLADANHRATEAYRAWEREPSAMLRSEYRLACQEEERLEALLRAEKQG